MLYLYIITIKTLIFDTLQRLSAYLLTNNIIIEIPQ